MTNALRDALDDAERDGAVIRPAGHAGPGRGHKGRMRAGQPAPATKYNVSLTKLSKAARTYKGEVYASMAEAHHAKELDNWVLQGKIQMWWPHPWFPFTLGDRRLGRGYKSDFLVLMADGHLQVHDVKGKHDTGWTLRSELFTVLYPDLPLWTFTYRKITWGREKGSYKLQENKQVKPPGFSLTKANVAQLDRIPRALWEQVYGFRMVEAARNAGKRRSAVQKMSARTLAR